MAADSAAGHSHSIPSTAGLPPACCSWLPAGLPVVDLRAAGVLVCRGQAHGKAWEAVSAARTGEHVRVRETQSHTRTPPACPPPSLFGGLTRVDVVDVETVMNQLLSLRLHPVTKKEEKILFSFFCLFFRGQSYSPGGNEGGQVEGGGGVQLADVLDQLVGHVGGDAVDGEPAGRNGGGRRWEESTCRVCRRASSRLPWAARPAQVARRAHAVLLSGVDV